MILVINFENTKKKEILRRKFLGKMSSRVTQVALDNQRTNSMPNVKISSNLSGF